MTSGQLDLYSVANAFAVSAEFAVGTGLGGALSVIVQRLYSNALNRGGMGDALGAFEAAKTSRQSVELMVRDRARIITQRPALDPLARLDDD
ncbi:MAG: hypothetical protein ACK4NV_05425 [Pannonibacter sp.]|jgi:hypothetical protein